MTCRGLQQRAPWHIVLRVALSSFDADRINPQQCPQCIEDKDEIKRSLNRLGADT